MTPAALPRTVLLAFATMLMSTPLFAQVSVGLSLERERTDYHFDAPSSYDTSELVPHFFEQHYVLDNTWLEVAVAHRILVPGVTRVAATPVRQRLATDYDTFSNPGGDVVVSGTTGDARVHGVRVEHEIELGRSRGIVWSGGYRWRLDRATFLAGLRTDVKNGVLLIAQTVTSPEFTNAQRHEVFFTGRIEHSLGQRWQVRLRSSAAPATLSRLAIRLPEKYPNQTLVYNAAGLTGLARLELAGHVSRIPVSLHLEGGRTWSYRSTARAERRALSAGISIGARAH